MKKKNKIILTIAIIIVALLIILLVYVNIRLTGAAVVNNGNTYMFKDEFPVTQLEEIDYLLQAYLGPNQFNLHLRTDPREAEKVPSEEDIREKILKNTEVIYVSFEPDLGAKAVIAVTEITKILGDPQIMRYQYSNQEYYNIPPFFSAVTEQRGDVLKKDCSDNSRTERVIKLQLGDETRIYSEGTCVIVEATNEDELIKAADKLVLQLLAII